MKINISKILIIFVALVAITSFKKSEKFPVKPAKTDPPFYKYMNSLWVDSVLKSMSVDEKIGQLFMIAAYSNKGQKHIDNISYAIRKYHVGGLIFFQGGPVRQANLTNYYQSLSKTPLLIAGDWEWGLSMRLDSTVRYPRQMMLGAIQDNKLLYQMGEEVARQCKRLGAQVNFAPVIDINNNPANPVIGSRSFGEDKYNVALKGEHYANGMQDNGILATGKHFPGHGDTDTDSHKALPIINHSRERLNDVELYPFRWLFKAGLGAVMVAHIHIPALDSTPNTATTLSRKVSTDLLKTEMGFKGIAFTDALNMKGVSSFFAPGEVDLKALMAGNDILLFPKSVGTGVAKIKEAIENKTLSLDVLDHKVRKILAVKYWAGLSKKQKVETKNLDEDLNNEQAKQLKQTLIENSLTLVKNEKGFIPFKGLDTLKIASISIGERKENEFQKTLRLYADVTPFQINKFAKPEAWKELKNKLKEYNLVIVSFNKPNRIPKKNYGISLSSIKQVSELAKTKNVVVDVFANPYVLRKFENLDLFKSVIVSYNDWKLTQSLSAQLIFGGIPAKGKLSVSVSDKYKSGMGEIIPESIRLKYTTPTDAGVNGVLLYKVDSIVLNSIREGAFPGCEVIAAKDGKVFYNKAFGTHTYSKKDEVKPSDIYDIASITKIVSTTISLMKLYDMHKVDLNKTLGDYLPYVKESNKDTIVLKNVLTHQAQLKAWIPFYLKTIKNDSVRNMYYSSVAEKGKHTIVADSMYILDSYRDSIYKRIVESKLRKKTGYKYSDLGFYLLQNIVEIQAATTLDKYVEKEFYSKLGAYTMGFNPLKRFPKRQIVPTEDDKTFRHQLVQGYVHDMGSAMLGGVAGHAGIFTNANDLAKVMQMLLNYGEYGGERYIKETTVKKFTKCQFCPKNRRAIGFDKPEMDFNKIGPTCNLVSANSFGHTGFTGTMVWADPDNGLLLIFLSNRINPSMNNKKLIRLGTRTKIQEVLYKAVKKNNNSQLSDM